MTYFTLNISHSDNSCQSGIQHGLKTYQAQRVFNLTAITALYNTAVYDNYENPLFIPESKVIIDQIQTVFSGPTPNAVKIGTVLSKESMIAITEFLSAFPSIPIVTEMTVKMNDALFNDWCLTILPIASFVVLPKDQLARLKDIKKHINKEVVIIIISPTDICVDNYNNTTYSHSLDMMSIGDIITASLARGMTSFEQMF